MIFSIAFLLLKSTSWKIDNKGVIFYHLRMYEYLNPEEVFSTFEREVSFADILVSKFREQTDSRTYLSGRKEVSGEFVIGDLKEEYGLGCCLSLYRSGRRLDYKLHSGEASEHQLRAGFYAEIAAGEWYDSHYQKYVAIKGGMQMLDLSEPLGSFMIDTLKDISIIAKLRGTSFKLLPTNWRKVINDA